MRLDFAGGESTSEAGLVLLREFDERLQLTTSLQGLVIDERDRRYIEHPTLNLLRQRSAEKKSYWTAIRLLMRATVSSS